MNNTLKLNYLNFFYIKSDVSALNLRRPPRLFEDFQLGPLCHLNNIGHSSSSIFLTPLCYHWGMIFSDKHIPKIKRGDWSKRRDIGEVTTISRWDFPNDQVIELWQIRLGEKLNALVNSYQCAIAYSDYKPQCFKKKNLESRSEVID